MEHNLANPFVPRASIVRFPNGIFEMRILVNGLCSNVEVTPHDNYVLVSGRVTPQIRRDRFGFLSSTVWTDHPCGTFSRDIPLRLNPGTQIVVLEHRQECDAIIIRYTLRNTHRPTTTCAPLDGWGYNGGSYQSHPGHGHGTNFLTNTTNCAYHGGLYSPNHQWHGMTGKEHHKDFGINCTCGIGHHGTSFNAGFHYDSNKGLNPQAMNVQGVPGMVHNSNGVVQEGFPTGPILT